MQKAIYKKLAPPGLQNVTWIEAIQEDDLAGLRDGPWCGREIYSVSIWFDHLAAIISCFIDHVICYVIKFHCSWSYSGQVCGRRPDSLQETGTACRQPQPQVDSEWKLDWELNWSLPEIQSSNLEGNGPTCSDILQCSVVGGGRGRGQTVWKKQALHTASHSCRWTVNEN